MTRVASLSPRLPGLRFEVVQPQRPDVLPRMDIAAFVGFSASGPLHVPVLVEDAAQFVSIFGDDLPLAWDAERGEQVYAYLAPALRAFFRNGGRRAWVVRVASEAAHTAWFPIPGLARFDGDDLLPAFAPARSPGAWADGLQTGAALSGQTLKALRSPLQTTCFNPVAQTLDLALETAGQVAPGDLLRLTCPNLGFILFPVSTLEPLESLPHAPESDATRSARKVRVSARKLFWLRPAAQQFPASPKASLTAYNHNGKIGSVSANLPGDDSQFVWPGNSETAVRINIPDGALNETLKNLCVPGAFVRVDFVGSDPFWLLVAECMTASDSTDLRLSGQGVWQVETPPDLSAWASPASIERLTFELWLRQPQQPLHRLNDLGFASGNPRFWAALPGDRELFLAQALAATGDSSFAQGQADPDPFAALARASLWQSAQTPRFPLAGPGDSADDIFLPLMMAALPQAYTGPDQAPDDSLVSDGLDQFSAALFLDPALADLNTETLLDCADAVRYTNQTPRSLRGIHAALSIDEVTLVVVPDAAQRGWKKTETTSSPDVPNLEESLPLLDRGKFQRCSTQVINAPDLWRAEPDLGGNFTLTWTEIDPNAVYVLEESELPEFNQATVLYRGPKNQYIVYGYPEGAHFFRVRAELTNDHEILKTSKTEADSSGTSTLTWNEIDTTIYVLEVSENPDFSDATTLYHGMDNFYRVQGYSKTDHFFRVHVELTNNYETPEISETEADSSGGFTLTWIEVDSTIYMLEVSENPDFSNTTTLYRGTDNFYILHDYSKAEQFFRVRIVESSNWSNRYAVRIAPGTTWQTIPREDYRSHTLRAIQLNLLRMCEARGDMFALLSIPGHFREQESIDYALALRSPFADAIPVDVPTLEMPGKTTGVWVAAIGYGEARSLSFGALYHPWLYGVEDGSSVARLNPPDGTVAGLLARRAYERGAWVAPANQAMRGVVLLAPPMTPARRLDLQQAYINLVRQEPQGFLTLSENTLSDDPDWTLINVRRLISLIRRLAQRYGPTWVFEPNDESFARLVERTFVSLLDQMFARGAFAGATPAASYQVNVRVTPKDRDEGRFIVELRVAPSLPMRFITIRLVQSGERSLVTEGG